MAKAEIVVVGGSQLSTIAVGGILCSLPQDTIEDKKKVFNILNGETENLGDNLEVPIKVTDIIATRLERTNDDNEVEEHTRVILIDEDGKAWASMSSGIVSSLVQMLHLMGDPNSWDNPLEVKTISVKTSGKNTMYKLAFVE